MNRLLPFIALIFAGALMLGYIMPTYKGSIAESNTRIKSYESALAAAKKFGEKEGQLEQQRAAISPADLARLEAFLPDGVDNVQLILDLDALAARSNMTLSSFDIDASKVANGNGSTDASALALSSGSPIDSLELTVTASGTYAQFRSFLAGIEQSLRPMDVVSIAVADGGTTNGSHKYTMTIRIYWLH